MEVGCYLEAITLLESIIFDRLASIVNEISEKDIPERMSFGKLIEKTRDIDILLPLTCRLDTWREKKEFRSSCNGKIIIAEF